MNDQPSILDVVAPPAPSPPILIKPDPRATRGQRLALLAGVLVVLWLVLQLFDSILLPFVAAAGIAYVMDPLCTPMARARIPRGLAALLLVIGLVMAVMLFALLLYPLVLSQIALLVGRVPAYAQDVSNFAARSIAQLQQHLGPEYVDAKLSDLVSGQAGSMLVFLAGALTRIVGGGLRPVQRAQPARRDTRRLLLPAAGLAVRARAHEHLGPPPLPDRRPRPGARGGPHPVRLGARPGDVLHDPGAVLRHRPVDRGAGSGAGRGPGRRHAQLHPLCRQRGRRRHRHRPRLRAIPHLGRRHSRGDGVHHRADSWKAT